MHYNTIEQLILFVPGIWFFAQYVHVLGAAAVGLVFIVGRAIYAVSYVKDPATRSVGMMLTMLPCCILVLGALGGAVWAAIELRNRCVFLVLAVTCHPLSQAVLSETKLKKVGRIDRQ